MDRCETCKWWERLTLTLGGCRDEDATDEVTSGLEVLYTDACFGCIHHEPKDQGGITTTKEASMADPQPYPCPTCMAAPGAQPDPDCTTCGGDGEVYPCPVCGDPIDPNCSTCGGEGNVPNQSGGGGDGGGRI